jgi:hypothetical protein
MDYRSNDPSIQQFHTAPTNNQYYNLLASRSNQQQQYGSIINGRLGQQINVPPIPPKLPTKGDMSTEPNDS